MTGWYVLVVADHDDENADALGIVSVELYANRELARQEYERTLNSYPDSELYEADFADRSPALLRSMS